MQPKVYLAGPINGLTYDDARAWRASTRAWLSPKGVTCIDPLRGFDHLKDAGILHEDIGHPDYFTKRSITARNFFDVKRSDFVLANFTDAVKTSGGTCMEVAWAHAFQIPVVAVMPEKERIYHESMMLLECFNIETKDLNTALAYIVAALGDTL